MALVTIAAAALIVGGALTLLRTAWGGDVARRIGLHVANQQLAGRLEVRRLRFSGDRLRLDGLVLRDPRGGAVVARVRQLDVAFRPLALLRGHVDLSQVALVGPELHLVIDPSGTNLSRAIALRAPGPPAPPPTSPSRFALSVGGLELRDGVFDLRDRDAARDALDAHLRASSIGARISGRLAVAGWAFEGRVSVKAKVEAPAAVPLSVDARAHGEGDRRVGLVSVALGGAVVDATAETHRDVATGGLAASAWVSRLHVPPSLARAVLPALPLAAPLDGTVKAAFAGGVLRGDAHLTSGGGALAIAGALDFARARLSELKIDGRDVDLGRVVTGLPRSSLSFDLRAHGAGRALGTARGALSFSTPGGLLGGYALGPVRLRAALSRGGVDLSELRAALPGATMTASGWARGGAVDLRASVEAADLGKTARSLGPALAPLALGGRGRLELSAAGSIAGPRLEARGRFSALAVRGLSMRGLSVSASLLGERLTADVRMAAPQPLSLHLAGGVALARGAASLDALELAYPEARWRLAAPTRIVVGPDLFLLEGLDLRSDAQAIRASVRARGPSVDARLAVSALDLARLPKLAQPPGHALGGRLDVTARVTGARRRPTVAARVSLAHGRLGSIRDLALDLDLAATRARLSGSFSARGLSTSARGKFDVPAAWPFRDAAAPLEVELALAPTDLAEVSRQLQLPGPPLGGKVALSLRVTGTPADPRARLELTTQSLTVSGVALGDPHLAFTAARGAPTRLRIDLQPGAAASKLAGTLMLETPAALDALLRAPPTLESLLRTPFTARGDLGGVPLAPVGSALGLEGEVQGTAALRLTAAGTARAPTGAVNVRVYGASGPSFPATDARVDLALGARDTRLAAQLWRHGQRRALVAASVTWGASVASLLWGGEALRAAAAAPLDARLYAGPVEVKRETSLPVETGGPPAYFQARARATAKITGTLSRPVVDAVARISEARLGTRGVGHAEVELRYADARAKLTATASSSGGGTLRVEASTQADLGYPQGLASLAPESLPIDVVVDSRAFDLAWLSGVSDAVRLVSGKLDARVRVGGSVAAPAFAGRLEWKDGALAVTEIGEYHEIHVALHAGQGKISIDDVRASSRGGTAHVTGQAVRAADGHLDLAARADLSRFPIYGQGDVLGTLSTKLSLRANASRLGAKGRIEIEEAKAELGEIRRKDVQSLDRPANVVLVAGGRPINHAEARKQAALEADRRGGAILPSDASRDWTAEAEIVAPRNLWVRGEEADLELGVSPGFKVETNPEVRVVGSVVVRRGTVNVIGRRFTLQKDSMVTFTGPPESPSLEVVAKHVNERSNVSVLVSVRGTPEDLSVEVSSPDRPDLSQAQLYSVLVTGQMDVGERAATGSSSLSNEAASLVGGLLASSIQKTLRKKLPLDVLTIQAGTGLTGSRLEAGTYLGDRLYVGYVGRVGSDPILLQNRNAVRVEYQLSTRWSLDAEYGDVGTGTADLVWNKHY